MVMHPNPWMSKFCMLCGGEIVHEKVGATYDEYDGRELPIYRSRCPKYRAWNPLTWVHDAY